jgi:hypothetical protein
MLQIENDTTLEDVDEAISHVNAMLKDDRYGNRLTHQKRTLLKESIDDLLDARLLITQQEESWSL